MHNSINIDTIDTGNRGLKSTLRYVEFKAGKITFSFSFDTGARKSILLHKHYLTLDKSHILNTTPAQQIQALGFSGEIQKVFDHKIIL